MKMKLFGLIGYPLNNSFSKEYFKQKFKLLSLPYSYENFPLEDISMLPAFIQSQPTLSGFNITLPYKQQILPYLDKLDSSAEVVGAVNCVQIKREADKITLIGYNTDVYGFEISLLNFIIPHLKNFKALVFGTGGASKAVCFILNKLNIPFIQAGRNTDHPDLINYEDLSIETIQSHLLLINCTAVGMFPIEEVILPIPFEGIGEAHYCYDLIYKPAMSTFLKASVRQGAHTKNGLEMLHLQADRSFEIWEEK